MDSPNGENSEVEVNEEIGTFILDSRREEDNLGRKERYHCYSLPTPTFWVARWTHSILYLISLSLLFPAHLIYTSFLTPTSNNEKIYMKLPLCVLVAGLAGVGAAYQGSFPQK